jgi:hypothetical protein
VSDTAKPGHADDVGDLLNRLLAGVVELLGEVGLVRARAEASPSLALAPSSSRWSSTSTDSIPNIVRPSIVSMPCSMMCRPMPRSRRSAPRVTRWSTDRERRSSRVTLNVSPSSRSCMTRSSFGRGLRVAGLVDVDVVDVGIYRPDRSGPPLPNVTPAAR